MNISSSAPKGESIVNKVYRLALRAEDSNDERMLACLLAALAPTDSECGIEVRNSERGWAWRPLAAMPETVWGVFDSNGKVLPWSLSSVDEDDARWVFLDSAMLTRGDGTGMECTGREWSDAEQLGYRSGQVRLEPVPMRKDTDHGTP